VAGCAQFGRGIVHDKEFPVGVVMGIVTGGTMDKAGAVKDHPLRQKRLEFRVRERIII
jgi:hypothetical protein